MSLQLKYVLQMLKLSVEFVVKHSFPMDQLNKMNLIVWKNVNLCKSKMINHKNGLNVLILAIKSINIVMLKCKILLIKCHVNLNYAVSVVIPLIVSSKLILMIIVLNNVKMNVMLHLEKMNHKLLKLYLKLTPIEL